MSDLSTMMLGARVEVIPAEGDDYKGEGLIASVWLVKMEKKDPIFPTQSTELTFPIYSVLLRSGVLVPLIGADRFLVLSIQQGPSLERVNPEGKT